MGFSGVWRQLRQQMKVIPHVLETGCAEKGLTDPLSKDFSCDQARHMDVLLPESA
jgi:hypothetical protein